jgi:hypothetical protein
MLVSEFIYQKINKGGIIIYDDYGDWVSKGAKMAIDEFFSKIKKEFIYLPTKQVIVFC